MKNIWLAFWLLTSCALTQSSFQNPWEKIKTPSKGESRAIGSYNNGCLAGGVSLPPSGEGYQFVALSRGRYYAHPSTLEYIERLGKKVALNLKKAMAVGDLSMPRGGLFSNGAHGSHQNGLDMDLWFDFLPLKALPLHLRDTWDINSVVDQHDGLDRQLNIHWTPELEEFVKMAVQDEAVERVFVNPAIKKFFCQKYPEKSSNLWVRKIRAWWGHDDHLHVRLNCPNNSPACVASAKIENDACNEIDWWWGPDYLKSTEERNAPKKDQDKKFEVLDACRFLL